MIYPMVAFPVTLNLDVKVTGNALDVSCAQLTHDLFAIAKFLF